MKRFKKRTIALVLASVVTVVGAFGADNYKNSLMGLSFEGSSGSSVNLVLQTKTEYAGSVTPMRTDANTYVLMLPEMNSEAPTPNLTSVSANITSVNIRTMPYSNNAKGYTRITIKTHNPSMTLSASNQVYVASSSDGNNYLQEEKESSKEIIPERIQTDEVRPVATVKRVEEVVRNESVSSGLEGNTVEHAGETVQDSGLVETPIQTETAAAPAQSSNNTYLWLWALLIILGSAFFYSHAKNKMREIAGEKLEIEVDDKEKKESKRKKLSKIKKTIKTLDSAYSNTSTMPGHTDYTVPDVPVTTAKPAEKLEIVDLDELFQEHKAKEASTKEEEENDALEDFLSGFSFDDAEEVSQEAEEEKESFDEETYEKTVNNDNLVFTKSDVDCINQLMDTEINDDTKRNIDKFAISNPVKKVPTKDEILENLVTTYAISQNIIFTKEDIDALYKLISVELDNDFITDLRTNPQKTVEMEKDILAYGDKPKKPSEIITLSVKDMLPDLSDVLANPDKYAAPEPEEIVVNEEALLKNITNVQFKPFYDGTNEFEVLNDFGDAPSVEYIQQEFSQFEGFEIAEEENIDKPELHDEYDDFKSLYSNEYVDLDKQADDIKVEPKLQPEPEPKTEQQTPQVIQKPAQPKSPAPRREQSESAQDLIRKIETARTEKEVRRVRTPQKEITRKPEGNTVAPPPQAEVGVVRCILDGEVFSVVSSVQITKDKGCYLAKNDAGYAVLGYIGEKLFKIKQYSELKSEKIHARASEKLHDGTARYIIRIGVSKFIINVKENSIDYLMDL